MGRVQGVSFRYFTCEKAASLGLKGWVRNLRTGGWKANSKAQAMPISGPHGRSQSSSRGNIEIEWLEFSGEYSDFRILV